MSLTISGMEMSGYELAGVMVPEWKEIKIDRNMIWEGVGNGSVKTDYSHRQFSRQSCKLKNQ
jgi:hypothetical protein